MKNNILEYKRYLTILDFDLAEGIIVGNVINTKDIISFHAETLAGAKQAFEDIIDTYLSACEAEGICASKLYSGKFNLRISPDLHRELSIEAAQEGLSLNELTQELIKFGLEHKHQVESNKFSH